MKPVLILSQSVHIQGREHCLYDSLEITGAGGGGGGRRDPKFKHRLLFGQYQPNFFKHY